MKVLGKIIFVTIIMLIDLHAWEINTHRAIDRKAIEASTNLKRFLGTVGMNLDSVYKGDAIIYDGYSTNYLRYIIDSEGNGVSQWKQDFTYVTHDEKKKKIKKATIQDLLEAGSILEDAQ